MDQFVGIEEQLARLRAESRAKSRQVMVMLALLGTLSWYFYGMRDWFDWDFSTQRVAPLDIGDPMETGFVLPPQYLRKDRWSHRLSRCPTVATARSDRVD